MESVESLIFEIILIFTLIFFNALFVAVEYAIIKLRNSELETLLKGGNIRAKATKSIKDNLDKYISATQFGITLFNVLLGWIGESLFSKIFMPVFNYFGWYSVSHTFAAITGLLLLTFLTTVIGELTPKVIAIQYPKNVALWLSYPLKVFYKIFAPFIILLSISSNLILKVFGIKPITKDEIVNSEEEIKYLISEGRKSGVIDSTEHQLIEKIFDFNDKTAGDIMVPRNNMIAIDIDDNREKIIQMIIDEGYSRIPVYKETIDNIIGILYSKDLISAAEHRELILLQDILRPVHFIPETKHIGELLKELQKKHIHLGIVINEHGGVEGLITLEDIIEEIVGEIEDEYDIESPAIQKDKKGIYLINPIIPVADFNKLLNTDIPEDKDEYHTLSGFLQTVTGHIPEIFERIDYKGLLFTITKKAGNKLLQVKIQRMI